MSGTRAAAAVVALAILIAGLQWVTTSPLRAEEPEICPPVTMDVLFPPTTLPPETTTTQPATTTTVATTTTLPAESTTTSAPDGTTIPADDTTTTLPETTTTIPETTTLPETATTIPETTTLPETTTTIPETTTAPPPPPCLPFVFDMAWPLAGSGQIGSPFGADRDGGARKHQGNDISAPKLTPVVAVADGVVVKVAQDVGTENCCWAIVAHIDGWQSYYIHLNNDRYGTDDGLGYGVRPDLAEGSEVTRGEVIGWVGDSGNAEETVDHLHFELRNPEGLAVDPRPSLEAALGAAVLLDPQPTWPYADDDGHHAEGMAGMLLTEGLLLSCDETMVSFCPEAVAAPEFAAALAAHVAGKTPPPVDAHSQPLPGPLQAADPMSLAAALGCEPGGECLQLGLPETEVARIAMWVRIDALVATLRPSKDPTEGIPQVQLLSADESEARLRAIGAIEACNPPLDSRRLLTRGETVTHLVSWIRGDNPEPCSPL